VFALVLIALILSGGFAAIVAAIGKGWTAGLMFALWLFLKGK